MGSHKAIKHHDHSSCISTAMEAAQQICSNHSARLTDTRKRVLELVWQSHKPMSAYDILPILANEGKNSAPPTVYRALDFLLEHGLIHRIASLNAYMGCSTPAHNHAGHFLICKNCHVAVELEHGVISQSIAISAQQQGFSVEHETVEILGLCPNCQTTKNLKQSDN